MTYRYRELEENKFHICVANTKFCAMHGHDFLEFSYLAEGAIEHNIDGNITVVSAGDYFIVDHGTMHEYKSLNDEPLTVINILFYPEFVEQTLAGCRSFEDVLNSYLIRFSYKTLRESPTGKTFHDNSGVIGNIVTALMDEYEKKKYGYIEYIRCLFVEMLIITMRKIGKTDQAVGKSDIIIEISEYMKSHYSEKIKLTDMAEKYSYSLAHISKKFNYEMGIGFSEYLQRIRLEQSCRLLIGSDMKVSEIAAAVGYDNLKFFNKVFKDNLKLTPREFKRLNR